MPLTRWILATKDSEASPVEDAIVNTLYFNVSGSVDDPSFTALGNDLYTIWAGRGWNVGRFIDIRGYNMDDPEPREQKFIRREKAAGTAGARGAPQVALALSYYADRNLPRKRGRIFTGPWSDGSVNALPAQVTSVMTLPPLLAALGGLNVDWSLWSPTSGQHTRINHAWCDNSWDIIRSRKVKASTARTEWAGNG